MAPSFDIPNEMDAVYYTAPNQFSVTKRPVPGTHHSVSSLGTSLTCLWLTVPGEHEVLVKGTVSANRPPNRSVC